MALPGFDEAQQFKMARHEAGHWLAFKKYGFGAGYINLALTINKGGAEIIFTEPPAGSPDYAPFLVARLKTILAGLAGQKVPRQDGRQVQFADPTEWKAYWFLKHDYTRFEERALILSKLMPVPNGISPDQYFFSIFMPEVQAFLDTEAAVIDEIHDALDRSHSKKLEAHEIEKLPLVADFIIRHP